MMSQRSISPLLLGHFIAATVASAEPHGLNQLVPRPAFSTADIEWTLAHMSGYDAGLVEQYRTQVAGGSVLQSNFGDENGFHEYHFSRVPPDFRTDLSPEELKQYIRPRENAAGTHSTLRVDEQIWDVPRVERPINGSVAREGHPTVRRPVEFPAIGLSPAWETSSSNPLHVPSPLYEGFDSAEFESGFEDGLRTVRATYGANRLTWYFDDRRGGLPRRAVLETNDDLYMSETDIQQLDGRWLPAEVRFYRGDSLEPHKVLTVTRASFDQPQHKQVITVDDLGAGFGTQFSRPGEPLAFWDGADLVSTDDFWQMLYGAGILFDENILKARAESVGMSVEAYRRTFTDSPHADQMREHLRQQYLAMYGEEPPWLATVKVTEKDPWDVHVEEFMEKHKLPEPAAERAKKTLERAKKLRDAFKYKIRFAEREGRKDDLKRYKEREERIFKDVLVRDLERLAKDHVEKQASEKPGNN